MRGTSKLTRITSSDTQDDLTNIDTGNSSVGLTPSTTHSSLQSIGTGARQHLVDTDDMVRVGADTEMETFLSGDLDQVPVEIVRPIHFMTILAAARHRICDLKSRPCADPTKTIICGWYSLVGANTSGFQSFGAQLFVLVGDQVDAEGELVDIRTLSAEIKDT